MVVHTYDPSTLKVEAEGFCIQDQPGLQSVTLSQKQIQRREGRERGKKERGKERKVKKNELEGIQKGTTL
jgi:hypothetical protein